jgi:hypothetical protein
VATDKVVIIPKTNKEIGKALMVRVQDTCAGGGHNSISKKLGKTWANQFKRANRPKKAVVKA